MLYACAKLSQGSRVLVLIFMNKIFVIGKPHTKITKIFLLENFQLYGSYFDFQMEVVLSMKWKLGKSEGKNSHNPAHLQPII